MGVGTILILLGSICCILASFNLPVSVKLEWLGIGLFMLSFVF